MTLLTYFQGRTIALLVLRRGYHFGSLSQKTLNKSLNFIFPINYVIPKNLKVGHWLRESLEYPTILHNPPYVWTFGFKKKSQYFPDTFGIPWLPGTRCRVPGRRAWVHVRNGDESKPRREQKMDLIGSFLWLTDIIWTSKSWRNNSHYLLYSQCVSFCTSKSSMS